MTDYPAIIWGTRTISCQKLEGYISSAIKLLKGRGIGPQDRLALVGPNSVEYVIVLLALWRMGAVACPLNPRWPDETIAQCCSAINPKAVLGRDEALPRLYKQCGIPVFSFNALISFDARTNGDSCTTVPISQPLHQEATIIWTSGSSHLKAAVHTWGNHYYSAVGARASCLPAGRAVPLQPGDRWVLSLPLYHVSGISIVVRCFLAGATIVIPGDEDLAATIEKHKPTHISLVATQLYRLLKNVHFVETRHASSLRAILLGGSAIPSSLIEKALGLGLPIYVSYGLTEMSSQVATGRVETLDKPCARVLPYCQLKIDSDGQILVKGETLFKGYWQQNKISIPLNPEGWFKTGDLGKLNDDGCLTVLGRADHMFICAGENIQPQEIEQVLLSLEGIEQAVVIPREDKEYGYRPVAFVKFTDVEMRHCLVSTEQMIHHCQKYLPKIKIPLEFYPWPQDLNQGMKISRQTFQARLENLLAK